MVTRTWTQTGSSRGFSENHTPPPSATKVTAGTLYCNIVTNAVELTYVMYLRAGEGREFLHNGGVRVKYWENCGTRVMMLVMYTDCAL